MKRIAVTLLAFAASALVASGSDVAFVPDNAPEADSSVLDILDALDDATLDALASKAEELEQAQIDANLRYNDAQRDYLAHVVATAAESGEREHVVAALLLAGSHSMRGHDFEPGMLDRLMTRSMAGATLRPDLLNALDIACRLLASAFAAEDRGATREPSQACDESATRRRLTAIEPANAHHWIRRLDSDLRAGDRETARAHLLATAHSTYWRPAFRTALGLMHATLTHWPPGEAFTRAARDVSDILAEAGTLSATDAAYFEAWRDPGTLVAQTTLGLSLILPLGPHWPTRELCKEAVAATDHAALAACRRLAKMMIEASDTWMDVMVGYTLLIETGSSSEAARAEAERDAQRTGLMQAYPSALAEHGIAQDLVADVANWIEHGEVEMMRRGLARVEAELARRAAAGDEDIPD